MRRLENAQALAQEMAQAGGFDVVAIKVVFGRYVVQAKKQIGRKVVEFSFTLEQSTIDELSALSWESRLVETGRLGRLHGRAAGLAGG